MSNNPIYSIVVPVFNAEQSLNLLVDKINKAFANNFEYEILLVDDGSKDDSWKKITELKSKFPEVVKAFKLSRNFGQHNATLCGILNSKGNWIVTLDDDLQSAPEDILKLIASASKDNADVIYGIHAKSKHGIFRTILSKLYKLVSKLDEKSNAEGSSFRLINGSLMIY